MKKIILVLGGVKSGKSKYACNLAKESGQEIAFIATASALDEEMERRIELHKRFRPASWGLFEEGTNIAPVLHGLEDRYDVVLIDCIALFISNLICAGMDDETIKGMVGEVIDVMKKASFTSIIVSNEVGCGIMPDNQMARRFGDLLGNANQLLADASDEVVVMYAGIPVMIKGVAGG